MTAMVARVRAGQQRAVVACVLAAMAVLLVEGGQMESFVLGESGTRCLNVSASFPCPTLTFCVGACLANPSCLGVNWMGTSCQLVSSLRQVVADPTSSIYVPDIERSSVVLQYPCSTCYGTQPAGIDHWLLECPRPGGVVVGVASASTLTELDYLVCTHPPGLTLDYTVGCVHQTTSCNDKGLKWFFLMTAVWCDNQIFFQPTNYRYQTIGIVSTQKVDTSRCLIPGETSGWVPGVTTGVLTRLQCPPHMMAISLEWLDYTLPPALKCCLYYD
nr:uncharacterized protein LOC123769171 [Procambarus clarkii]